jgi:predicted PurR-regulated permease PerM
MGRTALAGGPSVNDQVPTQAPMTERADAPLPVHTAARVLLALLLTAVGLWTIWEFVPAIVWAGVFAIAIWPLFMRARRRWPPGRHNILLPLVFTLAVGLLFVLPLIGAGIEAAHEAHGVMHWVQTARTEGIPVPQALSNLPFGAAQATQWWQQNLSDPQSASALLQSADRRDLMDSTRRVGAEVFHRVVLFAFCLLTLFFLLRDGDSVVEQMRLASRRTFGPSGERVGRQIVASVHGTVDGLVLVGLGEGVLLGAAYAVFGVPHPTLFGAVTAVAAIIPFGAPVAFCLAGLLLFATQGAVVGAIVIIVFGMIVTFVADHFIRPVLIGGATRLPFLWVLFGILGGLKAWGLIGLFVGPAAMAALILLWREWAVGEGTKVES